ncbi:MAG: diguanylate cyclase [Gammaproteobacteria bacterium]|nr:diguanylate cyclase [Gammaproteobacteria bacterium]
MTESSSNLAKSPAQGAVKTAPKPKILVIDDSRIVHAAIKKAVKEEFDVIDAYDGEEGWSKLREDNGVQMVITDQGMPRLDGFGLIKRIRESAISRIAEVPIIMVTGAEQEQVEIREKALNLGATDFLTKPFENTIILARARSYTKLDQTIRELEESEDALIEQAVLDALTGAYNHRYLIERGEKDISFAQRHWEELSLFCLELDNFSDYVLNVGQEVTDKLLKWAADLLKQTMRKEDTIARIGDCRFAVLAPSAEHFDAISFCERIKEKFATTEFDKSAIVGNITVSIGVASLVHEQEPDIKQLLDESIDRAKQAKILGGNRVIGANPEEIRAKLYSEARLQKLSLDTITRLYHNGEYDLLGPYLKKIATSIFPLLEFCNKKMRWNLDTEIKKISSKIANK